MSPKPQNSRPSARKPLKGRPFVKGQSGNPGGRPAVADLIDKVSGGLPRILEAYAVIALATPDVRRAFFGESLRVQTKDRLHALDVLLERRAGKVTQVTDVNLQTGRVRVEHRIIRD